MNHSRLAFDPLYDMPITKDVSQVLAEYYGYICQINGRDIRGGSFHVDHILPRALGGPDNLQNYITSEAKANIGKGARRHPPAAEEAALVTARAAAPEVFRSLTTLRDEGGGSPVNPIVVRAFRLIGLTTGARVASGAYLRSIEHAAEGVRWWGYWGPDLNNGTRTDILQFGVKLLRSGIRHSAQFRELDGVIERGGNTFYCAIDARLPMHINISSLERAFRKLKSAIV